MQSPFLSAAPAPRSPPAAPFAHSPAPATAPPSGAGESSHELGSLSPSSRASPPRSSPLHCKSPFTEPPSSPAQPTQEHDPDTYSPRRKRRKTKTRVFEIATAPATRRLSTGSLGLQGRGVKLSQVPNVQYALDRCTAREPHIEFIHRLMFNSAGQAMRRKTNIRSFSGFVFSNDKERVRCRDKILRAHINVVKKAAYVLDIDAAGSKEMTADAIMKFLDEPRVSEERGNRAEKAKRDRAEKKRLQKEREAKKKREAERKRKAEASKRADSDQDGDEDLEFEAKTWVEMAKESAESKALQEEQVEVRQKQNPDEEEPEHNGGARTSGASKLTPNKKS